MCVMSAVLLSSLPASRLPSHREGSDKLGLVVIGRFADDKADARWGKGRMTLLHIKHKSTL